jgi:hypothetical protein
MSKGFKKFFKEKKVFIPLFSLSVFVIGVALSIWYWITYRDLDTYAETPYIFSGILLITFLFSFLIARLLFKETKIEREAKDLCFEIFKKKCEDEKKVNDEEESLQNKTKYEDFARGEVYSLLRLTATLSTVIIGFTFSVR